MFRVFFFCMCTSGRTLQKKKKREQHNSTLFTISASYFHTFHFLFVGWTSPVWCAVLYDGRIVEKCICYLFCCIDSLVWSSGPSCSFLIDWLIDCFIASVFQPLFVHLWSEVLMSASRISNLFSRRFFFFYLNFKRVELLCPPRSCLQLFYESRHSAWPHASSI